MPSENTRILIINSVCDSGSTGRICALISTALASKGSSVAIAYGRGHAITKDGKKFGHKIGNELDIYIHGLKSRLCDLQGFGSAHATKEFLAWATFFNPDVIWLNNLHGYYINVAELLPWIKSRNSKVFWTLHDCWAFTGHCASYEFAGCEKWKTGCRNCPYRSSYPKTYISHSNRNYLKKRELFSGIKNMTLITPSRWLKQQVQESFLNGYDCLVIPNGIDLNFFYPEKKPEKPSKQRVILGVANKWVKEKGIDDFLKLSKMLSSDQRIVLVGELPKKYKFPNNITCIGKTNSLDELRRLYSSADVFFNPTYQDNFPTVNMEAIACHTPVVTYNVGGAAEMIDNRFSIKKGDIYGAYNMINAILNGKCKYDFSMRDSFSKDVFVNQYLKLFLA